MQGFLLVSYGSVLVLSDKDFARNSVVQWLDCMYWATFENWVNFSKIWARFVFGQIFLNSG